MFKAGASQVNITPPLGTLINGDFVSHFARFIHDDLYAKAIALRDDKHTQLLIVVDICLMDKGFTDEVKELIAIHTDVPAANILISATHTHAAGSVMSVLLGAADLPYRTVLKGLICQAAVAAIANLQPAQIAFGAVSAPEFVLCRRYFMADGYNKPNIITGLQDQVKTNPFGGEASITGPSGKIDPELAYMAIKSTDGAWISLLANYSLHYVGDWENGTISADYFGYFAARIKDCLSADTGFVGIMSNGTSGDANIWDFQNPDRFPKEHFKKSELIGHSLADKVYASLEKLVWEQDAKLDVDYTELTLKVRKPATQELQNAETLVQETDFSTFSINDEIALERLYAREQILLNRYPDTVEVPLQVLHIGSGKIGAMAGEFFAETGLKLKASKSSGAYFTITMANGIFGYVPPAAEMDRGGYETWRSRNSFLEYDAEEKVVDAMAELLNRNN